MISRSDIDSLRQRPAKPESPVLSVYLDTDQSKAVNVQRGFEVVLKNMLRQIAESLDKKRRLEFQSDSERVLKLLEDYRETLRGLAIFCDQSEDFLWVSELGVSVRDGVWWNETPFVRPLIELLDEHERYGVVLTDRREARMFTVLLGEIEELREAFASSDVTHIKEAGTDHLLSQMNIQRKADEHAHQHLKRVAEIMSRLARVREFDRLILAGTTEATSELASLLPKSLRTRIVRKISLPVAASEKQVLDETLKIEEEVERNRETELVEQLITAGSKQNQGVLGMEGTLLALQEWRVWQLIYADGFAPRGSQCTNCGALCTGRASCPYCGQSTNEISDLVDLAAARVLAMQGKVEEVRGQAATRLQEVGSIGALLRF
jgi:peptide subunit release factor 1 (eRF1)